jgi:hypothetical protein
VGVSSIPVQEDDPDMDWAAGVAEVDWSHCE